MVTKRVVYGEGEVKNLLGNFKRFRNYNDAQRSTMDWLKAQGFDWGSAKAAKNGDWIVVTDKNGLGYRLEWDPEVGTHFNAIGQGGKGPHFIFPGTKTYANRLVQGLYPDLY